MVPDREKVIKGIQECDLNGGLIGNCPYKGILALLKEQEAVIPKRMHNNERASFDNYLCECKNELYYKQKYCDECGKAVTWK